MRSKKLIITLIVLVAVLILGGLTVKFYGESLMFAVTNKNQVLEAKGIYTKLSKDRDNLFTKRVTGNIEYSDVMRESYLNFHAE